MLVSNLLVPNKRVFRRAVNYVNRNRNRNRNRVTDILLLYDADLLVFIQPLKMVLTLCSIPIFTTTNLLLGMVVQPPLCNKPNV